MNTFSPVNVLGCSYCDIAVSLPEHSTITEFCKYRKPQEYVSLALAQDHSWEIFFNDEEQVERVVLRMLSYPEYLQITGTSGSDEVHLILGEPTSAGVHDETDLVHGWGVWESYYSSNYSFHVIYDRWDRKVTEIHFSKKMQDFPLCTEMYDDGFDLKESVSQLTARYAQEGRNEAFLRDIQKLARRLDCEDLDTLERMLHRPPTGKNAGAQDISAFAHWMANTQVIIFDICFSCGEKSLALVLEKAWGEYDWYQGKAIEILIRFASAGIKRKEIVSEIQRNISSVRREALEDAVDFLQGDLEKDGDLQTLVSELMPGHVFTNSSQKKTDGIVCG